MWPWEHAVLGYVALSAFTHVSDGRSPGWPAVVAVLIGSQLPDLIDKPLAWSVGIVDTGYAVGHSVFFSLVVLVVVLAVGLDRDGLVALGIGHWLHAPADLAHNYVATGTLTPEIVLWPFVSRTQGVQSKTIDPFEAAVGRFGQYGSALAGGDVTPYLLFQLSLSIGAVVLWFYDGAPVLREGATTVHQFVLGTRGR